MPRRVRGRINSQVRYRQPNIGRSALQGGGARMRQNAATQAEVDAAFVAGYDANLTAGFTLVGNLVIPRNRTLWGNQQTIVANGGALVEIGGNNAGVRYTTFQGTSNYAVQWSAVTLQGGSVVGCTFTDAGIRVLQSSPAPFAHSDCTIIENAFNDAVCQIERMTDSVIGENSFTNTVDTGRAIVCYGVQNCVIRNNVIDRGITGILLLAFSLIARFSFKGNTIIGNTITNIVEESISIDAQAGNEYASARDTDDVAALPGNGQVTLASAAWAADSTYGGTVIDMVFINGDGVGKVYPMLAQDNATFTIDITPEDYTTLSTSDRATLGWSVTGNTISDNTITMVATAGNPTGVLLYGGCYGNKVLRNTVTMAQAAHYGILVTNLNGFAAGDSVTGNAKGWPSANNVANDNNVIVGDIVQWRRVYGSPTPMDLVDNYVNGVPMPLETVAS